MTATGGILGEGWSVTKVDSIQSQVVNGMEYKIVVNFANADNTNWATYEIVVYVPPGGQPEFESATPLLQ